MILLTPSLLEGPGSLCSVQEFWGLRNVKASPRRLRENLFPLTPTKRSRVREDVRKSASTAFKGEDLQWSLAPMKDCHSHLHVVRFPRCAFFFLFVSGVS